MSSSSAGRLRPLSLLAGVAASLGLMGAVAPAPAAAQSLIFDNFDDFLFSGNGGSNRPAGEAPLAFITVASPTGIGAIAVRNDLNSASNIRFVVYQNPVFGSAPVFVTAAKAFGDDGNAFTYKQSDPLSYTLLPGNTYFIGAIADVAGVWGFDLTGNTQNGITSISANGNNANFASPSLISPGSADPHIRLFSGSLSSAAPEPASLALLGLTGIPLVGTAFRRRKAQRGR